jgi:hypothetical protein
MELSIYHKSFKRSLSPAIFLDDFFWEWLFGNNAPERPGNASGYPQFWMGQKKVLALGRWDGV